MAKINIEIQCIHLSCRQPCYLQRINIESEELHYEILKARNEDGWHLVHYCKLFHGYEFKILSYVPLQEEEEIIITEEKK